MVVCPSDASGPLRDAGGGRCEHGVNLGPGVASPPPRHLEPVCKMRNPLNPGRGDWARLPSLHPAHSLSGNGLPSSPSTRQVRFFVSALQISGDP